METQETQNSHADLLNKRQVSGFQVPSLKTYYNSYEDRIPLGRSRMCRFRILENGVGQGQAGTLSLPFFLSRVWPDGHLYGVWQMQTGILRAGLLLNTEGMPVANTGLCEVLTLHFLASTAVWVPVGSVCVDCIEFCSGCLMGARM